MQDSKTLPQAMHLPEVVDERSRGLEEVSRLFLTEVLTN